MIEHDPIKRKPASAATLGGAGNISVVAERRNIAAAATKSQKDSRRLNRATLRWSAAVPSTALTAALLKALARKAVAS